MFIYFEFRRQQHRGSHPGGLIEFQSFCLFTHRATGLLLKKLIQAVWVGIITSLGRNLWMSRNLTTIPSKIRTIRLIGLRQVADRAWKPDRAMSDALVIDSCPSRSQSPLFLKKFGCVSRRTDLSVKVPKWSNRSGGASPSATQHSLIHLETNDRQDRWFMLFKTERVGFEPTVPVKTRWFSRPEP